MKIDNQRPGDRIFLCYSRSYLSNFLPQLAKKMGSVSFEYIAQTERERVEIEKAGGRVVLVLDTEVRLRLKENTPKSRWQEPSDFRSVTKFPWSPILVDRYLVNFEPHLREKIAAVVFDAVEQIFSAGGYAAFLSEPVAIFPTQVMLYFCKKNNIKPLLWAGTFVPGYLNFSSELSISKSSSRLEEKRIDVLEISSNIEKYIDGIKKDNAGPAYHPKFSGQKNRAADYFQQRRGARARVVEAGPLGVSIQIARLLRALLARLLFPRIGGYMVAGAVAEHWLYLKCLIASKKGYDGLPEGLNAENIFFPVQFEPEASLLYAAPNFRDQVYLVEKIIQSLPPGRVLWVKEHPNQYGMLKQAPWKQLKKKYENLRFIHGRESGRELIKKCVLGVSITSSAGMDALILGRKMLVCGDVYYRNFPGSCPIDGYADLAKELNNLKNYEFSGDSNAIAKELASIGYDSYFGTISPSRILFEEENIKAVAFALNSQIELES
jgi:hypothetical protein